MLWWRYHRSKIRQFYSMVSIDDALMKVPPILKQSPVSTFKFRSTPLVVFSVSNGNSQGVRSDSEALTREYSKHLKATPREYFQIPKHSPGSILSIWKQHPGSTFRFRNTPLGIFFLSDCSPQWVLSDSEAILCMTLSIWKQQPGSTFIFWSTPQGVI